MPDRTCMLPPVKGHKKGFFNILTKKKNWHRNRSCQYQVTNIGTQNETIVKKNIQISHNVLYTSYPKILYVRCSLDLMYTNKEIKKPKRKTQWP